MSEQHPDTLLIAALVAAQDEEEAAYAALRGANRRTANALSDKQHDAWLKVEEARAAITRRGHQLLKEAKGE